MHFNPYGGAAAQVAAGLVNIGAAPATELVAMMRSEGMSLSELSPEQANAMATWGRRLRRVFTEPDADTQVDLVNELLADSACRPFISRHDDQPAHLHYASERDGQVRRVQAYTAGGLAHLVCDDPGRIGACAREGCGIVYVDTSRNGRRRYCSTKCATRVHVADHRANKVLA
jgi:predicted RNA-binding Zn ribbon-like protein